MIFDCCHSASGTRGELNTRSVELNTPLADDVDKSILEGGKRGQHLTSKFLQSGLRSHVLIAACSSSESAMEGGGRGNFTTAFLKLLRTVGPERLRYSDILSQIDPISRCVMYNPFSLYTVGLNSDLQPESAM